MGLQKFKIHIANSVVNEENKNTQYKNVSLFDLFVYKPGIYVECFQ